MNHCPRFRVELQSLEEGTCASGPSASSDGQPGQSTPSETAATRQPVLVLERLAKRSRQLDAAAGADGLLRGSHIRFTGIMDRFVRRLALAGVLQHEQAADCN